MAKILGHVRTNALGMREQTTYEWDESDGDPMARLNGSALCTFDGVVRMMTRSGDVLQLGNLRVRVITYDYCSNQYTIMQDGWRAWFSAFLWNPLTETIDLIYRRSIITLAVWGLAKFNRGAQPAWQDIYALAWIRDHIVAANKMIVQLSRRIAEK